MSVTHCVAVSLIRCIHRRLWRVANRDVGIDDADDCEPVSLGARLVYV